MTPYSRDMAQTPWQRNVPAEQRRCYSILVTRRKRGEMPAATEALCWDCEYVAADEYDHPRGYADTERGGYIEPVCKPCHRLRHEVRETNGTGKPLRPRTVEERVEAMDSNQRERLAALKALFDERFDVVGYIAASMKECRDVGISSGMIAHALGVSRQYVSHLVKTWSERPQ